MMLLTKELRRELLKNGTLSESEKEKLKPVVKFFNPTGAATWLITEMDPDGDRLFGLCDLGFGEPELGYVSLTELQLTPVRFGLGIERDRWFTPNKTLQEYADEAREKGRVQA